MSDLLQLKNKMTIHLNGCRHVENASLIDVLLSECVNVVEDM